MPLLTAIGLMSGTSMDGIDIAALRTDGAFAVERGPSMMVAYEPGFRRVLEGALTTARSALGSSDRPGDLADLEQEITWRHAEAVRRFLEGPGQEWGAPDIIGFHGQTVLHRPDAGVSIQLGDGRLLAREAGIPVVFDMRANDLLNGGQGAPLAPAYHVALAGMVADTRGDCFPIAFVNIGGIANITFVPDEGEPVAFDTGPGNALIDQWVAAHAGVPFDAEGAIASEGVVVAEVVERYLDKPYFVHPAPKSLDRNDFGLDEVGGLELSDGARTLANVSAEAILKSVEHLPEPPRLWIVCGGGRKNAGIMSDLRRGARERGGEAVRAEEVGLDGDAMEAEAWAYLAVRSRMGEPLSWPTTTGCRKPVGGGIYVEP